MLDVRNPQIRVDELMQRIQEEVRARRAARPSSAATPPPAAAEIDEWQTLEGAFARAQEHAAVGATLPPMSRLAGLRRAVARPMARAFLRAAQLVTRDQREFNLAALHLLRALHERRSDGANQLAAIKAEIALAQAKLSQLEARLRELGAPASGDQPSRTATEIAQLRTSVSLQERRIDTLLGEAKAGLPQPAEARYGDALAEEAAHLWDAMYLQFEDRFRGSREDIQRRVAVYVPAFRSAGAGVASAPILDLGCGRGELLEVLKNEGLVASGVDLNRAAVDQCRVHGLEVEVRDVFEKLASLPDASMGGVAALHVVEHLPFALLLRLIDESLRVLRPGGVAIFESPNATNVLVGSASFYIDPTHRNPVHPLTLAYLLEARGFVRLNTMMLHPLSDLRIPEPRSELARRFNEYFYGPQDYAVVGHRA